MFVCLLELMRCRFIVLLCCRVVGRLLNCGVVLLFSVFLYSCYSVVLLLLCVLLALLCCLFVCSVVCVVLSLVCLIVCLLA